MGLTVATWFVCEPLPLYPSQCAPMICGRMEMEDMAAAGST